MHPEAERQYRLGCDLEDASRWAEAASAYRAALALEPRYAKAQNNLGGVLQIMGGMAEALECYEAAARIDPKLWEPHYNIGIVHKLAGRTEAAVRHFQESMRCKRGRGVPAIRSDPTMLRTSKAKLRHDIEQLDYLLARDLVAGEFHAVAAAYRAALASLPAELPAGQLVDFPGGLTGSLEQVYNRAVHFYDAPEVPGRALAPALDRAAIESAYARQAPGVVTVDGFLSPEALAGLRRFCLESTVWFDFQYAGGYLGAYFEDGFACPLLAQIAPEGGGLVVWDKQAPRDWDFEAYNKDTARMRDYLQGAGARAITVPHRQNRAVIFNSNLFHKTDTIRFRPGYENRRINITMLYGERGGA